MRALVVVLVVATFFAAGGERMKRIAAAFDWQGVMAPANFRIDAWVTPPTYTGRPPRDPAGPAARRAGADRRRPLTVPAGSTLVIRATGQVDLDVVDERRACRAAARRRGRKAPRQGTEERRFIITDGGTATVRGAAASDVTWQFTAIPDKPPTIALAKEPEAQARGSLQLSYKLEDDYGVVGAQAKFELQDSERHQRPRRRARSTTRPISRWCCRRRAPGTAPARPPRI